MLNLSTESIRLNLLELESRTKDELVEAAKDLGLDGLSNLRKQDIVFRILQATAEREGNYFAGGILETMEDGYGFLRYEGIKPSASDVYVSQSQIRRFALRTGGLRHGPGAAAERCGEVLWTSPCGSGKWCWA